MAQIKEISPEELSILKSDFKEAMKYARLIFGDWAFRKADLYPHKRKPINKALFEVWSVNLAKLNNQQRKQLLANKQDLMEAFAEMMRDDVKFIRSVTSGTGSKQQVIERFSKIKNLIKTFL